TRLQPQRIARSKADRLGQLVGDDRIGDVRSRVRWNRNLKPILAGVAGSADPEVLPLPVEGTALHEAKRADAGDDASQHLCGLGTLQRKKRLLLHVVDDGGALQAVLHVGDVAKLGGAVYDHVDLVTAP